MNSNDYKEKSSRFHHDVPLLLDTVLEHLFISSYTNLGFVEAPALGTLVKVSSLERREVLIEWEGCAVEEDP